MTGPVCSRSMERENLALRETRRELAIRRGDRIRRDGYHPAVDDELCGTIRPDTIDDAEARTACRNQHFAFLHNCGRRCTVRRRLRGGRQYNGAHYENQPGLLHGLSLKKQRGLPAVAASAPIY
jgi:hypothetical protein